ncbi:MAG: hypothetical protein EOO74_05770 [Myxococcales bacterium]|nr:MAG: hypothetical protein EOO74_05770 [Myxococcales bacterium]
MALDRAHPTTTLYRSTTGQALAVRYDRASNTLEIVEDDWAAGGFRSGVVPRGVVQQRVLPNNVTKLRARRRA